MKIKNQIHAIDLTIERHQYAIENSVRYLDAKRQLFKQNWKHLCPLCEFNKTCDKCPWTKFVGDGCVSSNINFSDNEASIKRLKKWRAALLKDVK